MGHKRRKGRPRAVALTMGVLLLLTGCGGTTGLTSAKPSASTATAGATKSRFTQWGWPLPYRQVSAKSVAWLKSKGWWPITVAWQGPFSGQNTINVVMDKMQLLQKRGISATYQEFNAGPPIDEAIIAGRAQVGNGGNFPFTTLLDKEVPVTDLATLTPNLEHCVVVPNNSPIKSLKDFRTLHEAPVGIVTGSSAEFFFQEAAKVNHIVVGQNVKLVNMTIPDQEAMPRGIAAVVPWEPGCTIISKEFKRGRIIATIFPYNFYQGNFYVRSELVKHVPDVVQAITDAFVEATLWIRLHPHQAAKFLSEQPSLHPYPESLLYQQTMTYNNLYKPTYVYPFPTFWGQENARISAWLYQTHRIKHHLTAANYEKAYDSHFMNAAFRRLGWAIPTTPPFIPRGWTGKIGHIPYPSYYNAETLKAPQPWPQKGDLTKAWQFDGKTYAP